MSLLKKLATLLGGKPQQPAPEETKVAEVNQQPVAPAKKLTERAEGQPQKKRTFQKRKDDSWLTNEVKKPAGKKPQTAAAGKTTRKAKASTK
jgi:hypothetical protein